MTRHLSSRGGRACLLAGHTRLVCTLAVVLAVCSVALPMLARANGPEVEYNGSAVYPIASKNIQLVEETVDVDLTVSHAESAGAPRNAVCTYRLRNLGRRRERFAMSFVVDPEVLGYSYEALHWYASQLDFEVTQDGQSKPVIYRPAIGALENGDRYALPDTVPVWDLEIAPLATSTVVMRYRTEWGLQCIENSCDRSFIYRTIAASLWAGRIERATIRVRVGGPGVIERLQRTDAPWGMSAQPAGHRWTADGLEWRFTNWEPDSDVVLRVGWLVGDEMCGWEVPEWNPWFDGPSPPLPEATAGLDEPAHPLERKCPRDCDDELVPDGRGAGFVLRVHVLEDGTVAEARLVDPRPARTLDSEDYVRAGDAMACLRKWTFEAARKNGMPVQSWVDVPYPDAFVPAGEK